MAQPRPRRVYPLDNRELTEEQIAFAFAMTSRSPEPFDEIAKQVSEQMAAGFHERWVLDYGHASVAEHAVVHLAVENISRLACDALEDNRLASYTEKSSRYQVMDGSVHVPAELNGEPELRDSYLKACRAMYERYRELLQRTTDHLKRTCPPEDGERKGSHELRLRRMTTDACRNVLPSGTLTNVGMTANARTLERAVSKLLSSELREERELGAEIRDQARRVAPTLLKYAGRSEYLAKPRPGMRDRVPGEENEGQEGQEDAVLVEFDERAAVKLAAALVYRDGGKSWAGTVRLTEDSGPGEAERIIKEALEGLGPHDQPPREFRRHRMQSPLFQPLIVANGVRVPSLVEEADLKTTFMEAASKSEETHRKLARLSPAVAQYAVTHAHKQRVTTEINLRELYDLLRLRTAPQAHESIRGPMEQALEKLRRVHPVLFSGVAGRRG